MPRSTHDPFRRFKPAARKTYVDVDGDMYLYSEGHEGTRRIAVEYESRAGLTQLIEELTKLRDAMLPETGAIIIWHENGEYIETSFQYCGALIE